ncbi:MAG: ATP-binding protein [Acidobacteriaceae bacterium]
MPEEICKLCEGAGLRVVERPDGTRAAVPCECRIAKRSARMIQQARIPQRYAHCTLDSYDTHFHSSNRTLVGALVQARGFVDAYPSGTNGNGLLFTGSIGVGKTHLAVGMLQALIAERGARGLFYDYRDLLKKIQDSYGRSDVSESQVLGPVFSADVLVLDELGAAKPTEWVWDTVQHILNTRYNDQRTTVITTNYPNVVETAYGEWEGLAEDKRKARMAMHKDTLGDRITERMRSRLQEMCVVVEMTGEDFRQKVKRASFA